MRILVVDDDPDYILLLRRNLRKTLDGLVELGQVDSYFVHSITNPETLSSTLFPSCSDCSYCGSCYDLVMMDTNLGKYQGYDLCREIHDLCHQKSMSPLHVIGMSSHLSDAHVEAWRDTGARGFYHKDMLINLNGAGLQPNRFMLPGKTVLEGLLLNYVSSTFAKVSGPKSNPALYCPSEPLVPLTQ